MQCQLLAHTVSNNVIHEVEQVISLFITTLIWGQMSFQHWLHLPLSVKDSENLQFVCLFYKRHCCGGKCWNTGLNVSRMEGFKDCYTRNNIQIILP